MGEQRKISINLLTKAFWCGIIITSKGFAYYEEEYLLKVKPLLSKINTDTFIEDYLQAHGIEQTGLYLSPEEGCLDNPRFYPNMDKGAELLKQAVDDDWKIGLLVD